MMLLFAVVVAFVALGTLGMLVEGYRSVPLLGQVPPLGAGERAPRVSIIVAARDEVHAVEAAARSLLRQEYPDLEVVAVDDRSTDGTREVLDRLAASEPRLRVVHVRELPAGWLGKTHALAEGAAEATGELLLFTDADVVLHPTTVARAVSLLQSQQIDHIAVGPSVHLRSVRLALVVNFFIMSFMVFQRPWRARNARSRDHIGIGAFNLVRRTVYDAAGGHAGVALRPDDDVKLGKAIKTIGARQLFAGGGDLVVVEWYRSLREMTDGLRKNSFAGMEYRVSMATGATLALLVVHVLPFVLVWTTEGAARIAWAVACLALMTCYAFSAASQRSRPWLAVLYPVAALLFTWIFVRNVALTLIEGGIEWRGTRYSLEELRRNRV